MALGPLELLTGVNGHARANVVEEKANAATIAGHRPATLDASKLTYTFADTLKPVPPPESLVFGQIMTDYMLVANFDPQNGWSAPEIKPYAPLSLDPTSSCFHYCTNVFEGMKAFLGPDGKARLFRPELNVARLARSAERTALPPFDEKAVLSLIKSLVKLESRWIPKPSGYSMYIRPTIIGTRPSIGVSASDSAMLFVVMTPTGPYFRTPTALSLLAVGESVRSWPGGTGGHKLGANYASGFLPQQMAAQQGYQQCLWLIGENVTEAGAMNFFVVLKRDDGDLDLITPPLDGTILPGLTRDSCLSLAAAHPSKTTLPGLPNVRLHTHERPFTMRDLAAWCADGKLLEAFGAGTAVIIAPVGRIGYEGKDLVLPQHKGAYGPVSRALWERIVDIQQGRVEWEGWSALCE